MAVFLFLFYNFFCFFIAKADPTVCLLGQLWNMSCVKLVHPQKWLHFHMALDICSLWNFTMKSWSSIYIFMTFGSPKCDTMMCLWRATSSFSECLMKIINIASHTRWNYIPIIPYWHTEHYYLSCHCTKFS